MSDASNPFAAWQQWWQQNHPAVSPFLPPTNLAEVEKRLRELDNVEIWLQIQIQTIQLQKAFLNQQKALFESMQSHNKQP